MRGTVRRAFGPGLLLAAIFAAPTEAEAFEYRRPGLIGPYTDRRITNPLNAMTLLGGPGSSQTFGQRYDERSIEAGLEYGRLGPLAPLSDPVEEVWSRFGIVFGLLPYLDAGAVFLNFKYAPNFDFTEVLVYVTQAFPVGDDWELAVRLSFLTPGKPEGWQLNPGVLAVHRGGRTKLELGVTSGIGLGALFYDTEVEDPTYIGLSFPVRGTINLVPALFLGLDTGFALPRFDVPERATVPLGAMAGYTVLSGQQLFDITASFKWDEFLYVSPAAGVDAVQADRFRVDVGLTLHRMAIAAPK